MYSMLSVLRERCFKSTDSALITLKFQQCKVAQLLLHSDFRSNRKDTENETHFRTRARIAEE